MSERTLKKHIKPVLVEGPERSGSINLPRSNSAPKFIHDLNRSASKQSKANASPEPTFKPRRPSSYFLRCICLPICKNCNDDEEKAEVDLRPQVHTKQRNPAPPKSYHFVNRGYSRNEVLIGRDFSNRFKSQICIKLPNTKQGEEQPHQNNPHQGPVEPPSKRGEDPNISEPEMKEKTSPAAPLEKKFDFKPLPHQTLEIDEDFRIVPQSDKKEKRPFDLRMSPVLGEDEFRNRLSKEIDNISENSIVPTRHQYQNNLILPQNKGDESPLKKPQTNKPPESPLRSQKRKSLGSHIRAQLPEGYRASERNVGANMVVAGVRSILKKNLSRDPSPESIALRKKVTFNIKK